MRSFKIFVLLAFNFVVSYNVIAEEIRSVKELLDLSGSIEVFKTKNELLSWDQLKQTDFEKPEGDVPNLGLVDGYVWVKMSLRNLTTTEEFLFSIQQPILDEIEFYLVRNGRLEKSISLGETKEFSSREILDPNYIISIKLKNGVDYDCFIRVRAREQIQLPIVIGTPEQVMEYSRDQFMLGGIYLGILLVMILYNLFVFFSVKDYSYLFYVIYVSVMVLTQTASFGYPFQFLWPNSPWMAQHSLFILPSLIGVAFIFFSWSFLKMRFHSPRVWKISMVWLLLYGLCIILAVCDLYSWSYRLIEISAISISLLILGVAFFIAKKGFRPAKFFLIAWTIFLVGVIIFILKDMGVLPYNSFTNYTMLFGSAAEVILLSFALADRINILKKEKEESQAQALRVSQENERLVLEQNVILEQKVEERTEELRESNKDLNTALDTLKAAQSQLVDAEKMASLGQLTAGIAHEINNPINFVTSNIKPLQRDIQDMLSLIEKYNEIDQDVDLAKKLSEIKDYRDDLDVDYVIEEMDSLLKGIDEGAQRTAEIVRGLKNFSRLDEAELKDADINEGLLSTLTVLNSNITRSEVNLSKELGELPVIECYPGKLNQVFMNIITNGVQAVNDNPEGKEKKILVKSDLVGDNIVIRIKDNGPGIPDDVRAKIFEPFFTTKDVGEGTGLGLSIVHSIIESHKGEIVLESAPGEGTEFIISLPVKK